MTDRRIAVVTGTSTGFGYQIAEGLARAGFGVFATMRDVAGRNAEPKRALEKIGVSVVELDVTDAASVERGASTILAASKRVDVLINNAGLSYSGLVETFTPEAIERQFAANVIGPMRLSRAFLPGMRERKDGLVVFVSSVAGRVVVPFMGVYAASKFALEALAETLSYELSPFGVDVAIVEPGAYETNIGNARVGADDAARVATYGEIVKLGARVGATLAASRRDASEIAEAIVALAQMPQGGRPLRTSLPAGSPIDRINATLAPIQRDLLEAYGVGELLPKSPSTP